MSRLTVTETPLAGLRVVHRQPTGDDRGSLARVFCATTLAPAGWSGGVAQINHTVTTYAGTVRGMHFQHPPHAEMKLVSCLRGEVWDVAVDLREGSPTFLKWHAEPLSAQNGAALLIPEGFAHGFQSLADDCELLYLHSTPYVPTAEGGVRFDDPRLRIGWPRPVTQLSARDQAHPLLSDLFTGLAVR